MANLPFNVATGPSGPIGVTGSNLPWTSSISTSAFEIRQDSSILRIDTDGTITTPAAGSIHADEWIETIKLMKQFIMDVSNDPELSKRFPYLQDAAYKWLMKELRK
jgi:hypothetical protein